MPSPSPTPSASPSPGAVLYEANWSPGLNGWVGDPGWSAHGGFLFNDGKTDSAEMSITAPYVPLTADYAVEARLTVLRRAQSSVVGVAGRAQSTGGYRAVYCTNSCSGLSSSSGFQIRVTSSDSSQSALAAVDGNLAEGPHLLRIEFKADQIRLLLDGYPALKATNGLFTDPGSVGLVSSGSELKVESFRVIAL